MPITISLSPEVEERLRQKATQQGQDISRVAAELLVRILDWELQDSEDAIESIDRSLDDFEAGRSRSFEEFASEQRRKYNL